MGLFDFSAFADPGAIVLELRKAFADMLAEQKKTNDILSKLLEDLSDGK